MQSQFSDSQEPVVKSKNFIYLFIVGLVIVLFHLIRTDKNTEKKVEEERNRLKKRNEIFKNRLDHYKKTASPQNKKAGEHIELGHEIFLKIIRSEGKNKEDTSKAIKYLTLARQDHLHHPLPYYCFAKIYYKDNEHKKTLSNCNEAIKFIKKDQSCGLSLTAMYKLKGDIETLEEGFDTACNSYVSGMFYHDDDFDFTPFLEGITNLKFTNSISNENRAKCYLDRGNQLLKKDLGNVDCCWEAYANYSASIWILEREKKVNISLSSIYLQRLRALAVLVRSGKKDIADLEYYELKMCNVFSKEKFNDPLMHDCYLDVVDTLLNSNDSKIIDSAISYFEKINKNSLELGQEKWAKINQKLLEYKEKKNEKKEEKPMVVLSPPSIAPECYEVKTKKSKRDIVQEINDELEKNRKKDEYKKKTQQKIRSTIVQSNPSTAIVTTTSTTTAKLLQSPITTVNDKKIEEKVFNNLIPLKKISGQENTYQAEEMWPVGFANFVIRTLEKFKDLKNSEGKPAVTAICGGLVRDILVSNCQLNDKDADLITTGGITLQNLFTYFPQAIIYNAIKVTGIDLSFYIPEDHNHPKQDVIVTKKDIFSREIADNKDFTVNSFVMWDVKIVHAKNKREIEGYVQVEFKIKDPTGLGLSHLDKRELHFLKLKDNEICLLRALYFSEKLGFPLSPIEAIMHKQAPKLAQYKNHDKLGVLTTWLKKLFSYNGLIILKSMLYYRYFSILFGDKIAKAVDLDIKKGLKSSFIVSSLLDPSLNNMLLGFLFVTVEKNNTREEIIQNMKILCISNPIFNSVYSLLSQTEKKSVPCVDSLFSKWQELNSLSSPGNLSLLPPPKRQDQHFSGESKLTYTYNKTS